jgi:Protein of unknown function (DUF1264)
VLFAAAALVHLEEIFRMKLSGLLTVTAIVFLAGCGGKNTRSYVESPGAEESGKTKVLETGTAVLQNKAPIDAINVYMDGFHFYNGNMQGQMEAHHYCSVVNEDLNQCIIFDGNSKEAKLMGVEYIVSRKVYESLPADEKKLWHSHAYEVSSGELVAPGVPSPAEHAFMEKMASTYGKTWHTWNTDQNRTLPTGYPLLMMGFTADGQIHPDLIADRDKRFGVSMQEEKQKRADIHPPPVVAGADSWAKGPVLQLSLGPLTTESLEAVGKTGRTSGSPKPSR